MITIVLCLWSGATLFAQSDSLPTQYRRCVTDLVATRDFWDRLVPSALFAIDRRFFYLRDGIRVTESNMPWVDAWVGGRQENPKTEHLISNALVDCQLYRAKYSSYARWCVLLIYFSAFTTLAIFLKIFLRKRGSVVTPVDQPNRKQRAS